MPLEQCYVWILLFRIWLQSRHTALENWCLDKKAWVSYSWQFCVLVSASEVNMRSTRKMNNSNPLNIMIWKCGVVVAVVVVEVWQTGIKQLSKAMAAGPWQWGCMSFCSQICTKSIDLFWTCWTQCRTWNGAHQLTRAPLEWDIS